VSYRIVGNIPVPTTTWDGRPVPSTFTDLETAERWAFRFEMEKHASGVRGAEFTVEPILRAERTMRAPVRSLTAATAIAMSVVFIVSGWIVGGAL